MVLDSPIDELMLNSTMLVVGKITPPNAQPPLHPHLPNLYVLAILLINWKVYKDFRTM